MAGMPAVEGYTRTAAIEGVRQHDRTRPPSRVGRLLEQPENDRLLGYVFCEAFTHVFAGDKAYRPDQFFADLDVELRTCTSYHLWAEVPLCRYRCHFCQFPILVMTPNAERIKETAARWVDANIAEAKLWLERVPALRTTRVGEFCLFGGTPTAIPQAELVRLCDFYFANFAFTSDTSLRLEGSPDSLTKPVLQELHEVGFKTLTFGIQSFDDDLLRLANRQHSGQDALAAISAARDVGFERVDGDLVWGLPGQTVTGFERDVQTMLDASFDTVVIIKLHLRSFHEVDTAIGHVKHAAWELPAIRQHITNQGYRWPSLGEQFQMRETAVEMLRSAGHYEHPTTYFPTQAAGAQMWRALNLDQDKQVPQVGIGLGGYTWSSRSEADIITDPHKYLDAIKADVIPFQSVTSISDSERERRAVRMALSTCQSLHDDVHQLKFPGSSLLEGRWLRIFRGLEQRGFASVDRSQRTVELTDEGKTLVEAIMHTEIR
jgi:oxygen-independent coproporphyrinogen-3 oxidase